MGWRRRPGFYNLKRIRARQSWNKFNLYNLARLEQPLLSYKTYFQQKWLAKSLMRAYHGEYIREGQWENMFRRYTPSVIPMDHNYLAETDGSLESAGRGSGADRAPDKPTRANKRIPYMQMVFWPMERRLDQAIFRALFASSARQAKQFVTHGHVKVNGKKMIYPGYLLNPGDMFQVDVDSVMFATGAPKHGAIAEGAKMALEEVAEEEKREATAKAAVVEAAAVQEEVNETIEEDAEEPEEDVNEAITAAQKTLKTTLKSLRDRTKAILKDQATTLTGKQKQTLRAFTRTLRSSISKIASETPSSVEDLDVEFHRLTSGLTKKGAADTPGSPSSLPSSVDETEGQLPRDRVTEAEAASSDFQAALKRASENPVDPSKPYATPWRPRDYMAPFAFIPRYLEVNQRICAAVYLRHPVARPGLAEVPSPYGGDIGQLAFNWYLKRR